MSRSFAKRRVIAATALVITVCVWLAVSSSLFPAFSDDHAQTMPVIESNDPRIIQTGQWTSQAAAGASGGSYLYNAPANPDRAVPALALQFSGSYLEVIYVSGPNLGTLAIEVDGTVLRTVITANDRTLYNQRTTINYLTDEGHTLRVYAQAGGVVGVDAFTVNKFLQTSALSLDSLVAPTNLLVTTQSLTALTLTWTDSNTTETEYRIERSSNPFTGFQEIAIIPAAATYTFTVTGLASYTDYYFRVRAYRSSDGAFSGYSPAMDGVTYVVCTPNALVQRVTVNNNLEAVNANDADMTGDGRYIVFSTYALQQSSQIYVYDRLMCNSTLISRTSNGQGGNGSSIEGSLSADAHWVVFASLATNLVANTTTPVYQIYLYNSQTGQTILVSHSSNGTPGDAASSSPEISPDGRFITFQSNATNLVANDAVPSVSDVYVYDRLTDQITRVSVDSNGNASNGYSGSPTISDDGRFVAFESNATNLVPNDTNARRDIFVHNRQTGQTSLVSTRIDGTPTLANSLSAMISGNGRYVVFVAYDALSASPSEPGYQVYLRDLQTGLFELISRAPDGSFADRGAEYPVITPDGRYVFFVTGATNLGDDGPDHMVNVFDNYIYDRQTQTIYNANRDYQGNVVQVGSGLERGAISDDGLITLWHPTSNYALPYSGNSGWAIFNRNYLPSPTPTNTPTATNTATDTATWTSTPTETPSATSTPTDTSSTTPSNTPSYTPSATATVTATSTNTPSVTPSATASSTPSATPSTTPSSTNTPTSTATVTSSSTVTASYTPSKTATRTPSPTWTPSPTSTATRMAAPQNYDTLAIYNTQNPLLYLLDTLNSQPATSHIHPISIPNTSGMVGVMGDWNGDGQKTPGYYLTGVFYITNTLNPTSSADWVATWFGLFNRPAIAGRFAGSTHDCIGVVDSGNFPPYGTAFALYYTCDLTGGNPAKTLQWLSVVLPDNQGYSGTHQFETGDFDGDGFDSVAIRRGAFIAFTNVTPGVGHAAFNLAQYWGIPDASSEGDFVAGDWDGDAKDSFGVYYPTTHVFYRRNDLQWNSGVYVNQSLPTLNATVVSVSSWRVR